MVGKQQHRKEEVLTTKMLISMSGEEAISCCLVCGAVENAGRHYGSVCCSGCKGFFRRSVRFQKLYRCPYGQQCAISKLYRNCCRACRFEKCLRVGLDPKLVQSDWGQSGGGGGGEGGRIHAAVKMTTKLTATALMATKLDATTFRVKEEPPGEEEEEEEMKEGEMQQVLSLDVRRDANKGPLLWHNQALHSHSSTNAALGAISRLSPAAPSLSHSDAQALADFLVRVEKYCDFFSDNNNCLPYHELSNGQLQQHHVHWDMNVPLALGIRQPNLISSRWPIRWGNQQLEQGSQFAALWCRLLVMCIDWASHLPELFSLAEEDRFLLFKQRLMRSMWWMCAHRSVPFKEGTQGMVVGSVQFYPREPALQAKLDPSLQGMLTDACNSAYDQLIQPMRMHGVTEAEAALLRAIAFFTPVSRLSADGHRLVQTIRNKYLSALSQLAMRKSAMDSEQPTERLARLLMLLTSLEQTGRIGEQAFIMFATFNLNAMQGHLNYELHSQ